MDKYFALVQRDRAFMLINAIRTTEPSPNIASNTPKWPAHEEF